MNLLIAASSEPDWVGVIASMGKVAGGVFAVGALVSTRPFRWIIKQVLGNPVGNWLDTRISTGVKVGLNEVKGELAEMHANQATLQENHEDLKRDVKEVKNIVTSKVEKGTF